MKISSNNEWDNLNEVILGNMDSYFPGLEFNRSFKQKNFDKAKKIARSAYPKWYTDEVNEDLNNLKNILKKKGIKVLRPNKINFDEIFYTPYWSAIGCDSYNVRDLHIVVGNKIISSPSPSKFRYFEPFCLQKIFYNYFKEGFQWINSPKIKLSSNYLIPYYQKHKKKITTEDKLQKKLMKRRVEKFHKLTEEEILFDSATIIRMNNDLVYLVSNSGNYLGAKWLQLILGKKYRIHIATNYRSSHIDSTILPLNTNTVLINSVRVLKNKIPKVFNNWKKIFFSEVTKVPDSELNFQNKVRDKAYNNLKEIGVNSYLNHISSPWAGLNVLSISPDTVLVDDKQTQLIKELERNRFTVIGIRLRHCYTMLGGLHCSTLDTVRN